MNEEFFEKLNKGMNIETNPIEEPEVELMAAVSEKPEENQTKSDSPKTKKPAKKRKARKKTSKKKTTPKKSSKEKKIEIKEESSIDEEEIDQDVFQKEGQLTVDVFETEKDIIIQSVVAGVEAEDLDISIEKDMVSIKGQRQRKIEEKTENFFHQECFWGRFSREVVLPSEVDKDKAEASIKNGVLTIKIPKINTSNNKKLNINVED